MVKILDASALMVYLEKQSGYEKVEDLLAKAAETERDLLISAVNWGEVCYISLKNHGQEGMEKAVHLIGTFPVEVVSVDSDIAQQAALFKIQRKLPYVDCFAAALAKLRKGELVTTDKDFKAVEAEIKIVWV